jgi:hypothetical protein
MREARVSYPKKPENSFGRYWVLMRPKYGV